MKKFGLIGNPISTSKSPALFEAGYHGRYGYDLIENSDFETAYAAFLDGYDGINVTAPFKLDAFRKADRKSAICKKTGAANLLIKDKGGITAYNTDYYGIVLSVLDAVLPEGGGYGYFTAHCIQDSLQAPDPGSILDSGPHHGNPDNNAAGRKVLAEFRFDPPEGLAASCHGHSPRALVAGCGGAGRAAAVAAASLGYRTTLMNRSVGKAEKIASEIPEYGFCTAGIGEFPELFRESDLVIYTIPGSIPELENMSAEYYAGTGKIVLEANYKNPSFGPAQTACLEKAGGIYIPGRRWLLYQALTGFRIFTGENPDFQQMCKVI